MSNEQTIDEIIFGPLVPPSREAAPLVVSVLRELTEDDLPDLVAPVQPALPTRRVNLQNITYAHHALAQQIVEGKSPSEVSLITGYSTNYIKGLQEDPLFKELLDYYGQKREKVFVDALERMKALGLASLDELQRRLAETADSFSRRELMELSELMLIRGARVAGPVGPTGPMGQPPGSPAVSVTVKFVQSRPPEILPPGETIEATAIPQGDLSDAT